MKQEFIDQIIQKNPQLNKVRNKLEAMKSGSYCLHRSWGFGVIRNFDELHQKLVIDFEGGTQGHAMDPVFCIERLEILPESNILVRYKKDTQNVEELIKKQPVDLIVDILSQMPGQEANPSELEGVLERLLGPTKFKKWWTSTKKLLAKDPRISIPNKKTDPYILRIEPIKPEEEILEEFYKTAKPLDRIRIAEKLLDNSEAVQTDLPRVLEELSRIVRDNRDLSKADRLHGIWVQNDLAKALDTTIDPVQPSAESMVDEEKELVEIGQDIPSSYHKRFLDLVTSVHEQRWTDVILQLVRSSEGKFTAECMNFLADKEKIDLLGQMLQQWLNEQTFKAPVLMWIIKNRHSRRFRPILSPLMEPRLLAAILSAVDYEALQQIGNKRIPLADLLSEDSSLIADLLLTASTETAHDLAQTLLLNQGFEPLTKKSLLARFIKCFPTVQALVAGSSGEARKEAEQLVVSQKSFDERKKEYEILTSKKIPENKEAIATAREHGDLKENSEYKMARQDQETLMSRKAQLESELGRARVTDFQDTPANQIGVGAVVEIKEGSTDNVHRYAILGAWDSDPTNNILSYKTPLSQSLIGKQVGDVVETIIGGHRETWTIRAISRWVDNPNFKA